MPVVVEHIEAVTPADILELADTLLNDHRISLTILGPASGAENLEDILQQTTHEP